MLILQEGVLFLILHIMAQTSCFGSHGAELHHPVAPVDIQKLCDGAQVVGGIVVAVPGQVVPQPVVTDLHAAADLPTQVVAVRAVGVDHLAQLALTDHTGGDQLVLAVAAVFQEHKGGLCLFPCAYQFPAVVHAVAAADLQAADLALLHGLDGQRDMRFPGSRNDNGIHIGIAEQVAVVGIFGRFHTTGFQHTLCFVFCSVRILIAHSYDIHIGEIPQHIGDQASAPLTQS